MISLVVKVFLGGLVVGLSAGSVTAAPLLKLTLLQWSSVLAMCYIIHNLTTERFDIC